MSFSLISIDKYSIHYFCCTFIFDCNNDDCCNDVSCVIRLHFQVRNFFNAPLQLLRSVFLRSVHLIFFSPNTWQKNFNQWLDIKLTINEHFKKNNRISLFFYFDVIDRRFCVFFFFFLLADMSLIQIISVYKLDCEQIRLFFFFFAVLFFLPFQDFYRKNLPFWRVRLCAHLFDGTGCIQTAAG